MPAGRESQEIQEIKNSGNELKEVLENKGRELENEPKTNSKRTQIECKMRALKAEFAAFDATRLLAAAVANPETLEKTQKIVGTNSRKYLKTKEESSKMSPKRTQNELKLSAKCAH
jgi:hypothetical protein